MKARLTSKALVAYAPISEEAQPVPGLVSVAQQGHLVFKTLDRLLDGLVVGQHAAEPAVVNKRHAGARCFFADDFTGLALGADEQDGALVRSQLAYKLERVLVHRERLLKVDDVDFVAGTEDERGHFGVPEAGLMPEMDTGFQHLTHGDRHSILQS